jgi:hypothetical protein
MKDFFPAYYDNLKSTDDKIILPNIDEVAPSPSEKLARKEIGKLTQNSDEIKKFKERIEKK